MKVMVPSLGLPEDDVTLAVRVTVDPVTAGFGFAAKVAVEGVPLTVINCWVDCAGALYWSPLYTA